MMRPRLLLLAALLPALPVRAQAGGFAVSYIWLRDLGRVQEYEQRVGKLLGPAVRAHLQIVHGGQNYGLIYLHPGDLRAAAKVARRQSRLLVRHGLQPAAAIVAPRWLDAQAPEPSVNRLAAAPVRRLRRQRPLRRLAQAGRPLATPVIEAAPPPIIEPAPVASKEAPPETALQHAVEDYIESLRRARVVLPDERTAWLVYDLRADKKLVAVNEDMPLEAASMIKPFIALAYEDQVASGRRHETWRTRRDLQKMIQISDNRSADRILRQVGGPQAAQQLLMSHYGNLLQQMRLVEYIPRDGRTYRNRASAHDYSRFLYALWHDALPGSAELKMLMGLPKRDRIARGTEIPNGVQVIDKTGTTSRLCGDMGVIVAGQFAYTIVGVIQKGQPERSYRGWMRRCDRIIADISNIVYGQISKSNPATSAQAFMLGASTPTVFMAAASAPTAFMVAAGTATASAQEAPVPPADAPGAKTQAPAAPVLSQSSASGSFVASASTAAVTATSHPAVAR